MERILHLEFESELKCLLEAIYLSYGYDFRRYSLTSVKRTVVAAMDRMGCGTLPVLREKVLRDVECFNDLIQSLTVSVSEMFRDPPYFVMLREKVLPILKTYPSLKVWVAGCSTGQEVYSLAILLQEEGLLERTTLYATDINPKSLTAAEKGVFPLKEIATATQNYQSSGGKRQLSDYYTVSRDSVAFAGSLKANITFADHSLVTDSVFAEAQLISCRNVLIYFNRELQDRAFELFKESLCRRGFLGLGSKETVQFSKYAGYFDAFEKRDRIYRKI